MLFLLRCRAISKSHTFRSSPRATVKTASRGKRQVRIWKVAEVSGVLDPTNCMKLRNPMSKVCLCDPPSSIQPDQIRTSYPAVQRTCHRSLSGIATNPRSFWRKWEKEVYSDVSFLPLGLPKRIHGQFVIPLSSSNTKVLNIILNIIFMGVMQSAKIPLHQPAFTFQKRFSLALPSSTTPQMALQASSWKHGKHPRLGKRQLSNRVPNGSKGRVLAGTRTSGSTGITVDAIAMAISPDVHKMFTWVCISRTEHWFRYRKTYSTISPSFQRSDFPGFQETQESNPKNHMHQLGQVSSFQNQGHCW